MAEQPTKNRVNPRSFRIDPAVLHRAAKRAALEGTNLNQIVGNMLQGYGDYRLDAPRVVVVFEEQTGE